jgi:hypothetical protein
MAHILIVDGVYCGCVVRSYMNCIVFTMFPFLVLQARYMLQAKFVISGTLSVYRTVSVYAAIMAQLTQQTSSADIQSFIEYFI